MKPEEIPVKVVVVARWAEPVEDRWTLKFTLNLVCEDRIMPSVPYSGDILAFSARDNPQLKRKAKSDPAFKHVFNGGSLRDKNKEKDYIDLILMTAKVSIADVCHSLLLDGKCGEDSFEDFCANCGYATDSRKAFETYTACQKNGREFRTLVGASLYSRIDTALEGY